MPGFTNAADMVYRRGAPDTFDPSSLLTDLCSIKTGSGAVVELPGFSHAVGNPVPAQHTFLRDRHRVVIVEGLYLLHQGQGWDREQFTKLLDLSVYIRYTRDGNLYPPKLFLLTTGQI